jgi:hypothetical protein
MLLYDLDFLGLEKFCLDYEILYEYIFAEIEFKIYETNYFQQIGDNVIFDVFFFFWHGRFQFLTINFGVSFSQEEGNNVGYFLHYFWHNYFYCIIFLIVKIF